MSNMIVVEAATVWCDPHRANQLSGKVQCDLIRLDKATVDKLKKAGINVNYDTKNADDSEEFKGFWIRAKSATPVPTKDMAGNELPPNLFIGNGSRVIAAIEPRDWFHKDSGRSGVSCRWLGLRVKEFIKYDPDATAKAKADQMLDEQSGGDGFVFGESTEEEDSNVTADTESFDAMFDDEEAIG